METVDKLVEISSRIEHLENAAEWLARETVHGDNTVSQTGTLIAVLAEDIREKIYYIIQQFEQIIAEQEEDEEVIQ